MNIQHMINNPGRFKAIIKDVAGRRMLVGFERTSKRSRKANAIYVSQPIDLDQLTKKQPANPVTQDEKA